MTGAIARAELNRGLAARDAGNYPAALKALQSVIQIDPGDPLGFLYLGDLHLRQGRYTLAVSTARTGLAMPCSSSNRSFGLQILALAFINLKKPRKAIAAGLDAIQNDPANASNHRVYAQTLWSAKKLKAAEAQFQHALQLNPQLLATLTTYARFLKGLGRLREARDVVERATLIEPDNIDVLLLRGQIAFKYDELETARDLALWVLSRQAMNKKALELLAMVKSRRSWLTGPFWWFANFLSRYRKTASSPSSWSSAPSAAWPPRCWTARRRRRQPTASAMRWSGSWCSIPSSAPCTSPGWSGAICGKCG